MMLSRMLRFIWRKAPAALAMAVLYLVLCLCMPITVTAAEADGGDSVAVEDTSGPDLSVGTDDVDISTPLAPPAGSAEIVEVEVENSTENKVEEYQGGTKLMETEFENDSPSVTFTETFNIPGTDLTIPPDADPDETAAFITDTMQPITVPAEGLIPETRDVTVIRDGDSLIRTTISESDNAIQKAVNEAVTKADSNTKSITIRVAAGEYSGDINIQNTGGFQDLTLYILAEDSYTEPTAEGELIDKDTIHTGSKGNVVVTGNIIIGHLNVIMAGLYLSQGQSIQVEGGTVTYNGTVLGDKVTVDIGDHSGSLTEGVPSVVTVNTGDGSDTVSLTSTDPNSFEESSISVNTGSGDDVVQIDTAVAQEVGNITVNGGVGNDRLHLTGGLKEDATHTVGKENMNLTTKEGKQLSVSLSGMEDFTDDLTGKPTSKITEADLKLWEGTDDQYYYEADQAFHNYVIDNAQIVAKHLSFVGPVVNGVQQELFMANLKIVVEDILITYLDAPSMNIVLEGENITIAEGATLNGNNITMIAEDSDANLSPMIDALTGSVGLEVDVPLGILEFSAGPEITIGKNAKVNADGSVILSAAGTVTQPLVVMAALYQITKPEDIRAFDRLDYAFDPVRSDESTYVFVKKGKVPCSLD